MMLAMLLEFHNKFDTGSNCKLLTFKPGKKGIVTVVCWFMKVQRDWKIYRTCLGTLG
jgi:hypothetical protein